MIVACSVLLAISTLIMLTALVVHLLSLVDVAVIGVYYVFIHLGLIGLNLISLAILHNQFGEPTEDFFHYLFLTVSVPARFFIGLVATYLVLNFFIRTPGIDNASVANIASGHWILLSGSLSLIYYSVIRNQRYLSKCINGHRIPPRSTRCSICGQERTDDA